MVTITKTPAVLSSEILLKSSGYAGWFILLEGDFDQRFWTPRLNLLNLKPINCVGKPNVLNSLELLICINQAQKIVALVDKDYDEILMRPGQFPQLIYTDENDLEVTLLRCSVNALVPAMERILDESIEARKRQKFEERMGYSVTEHLRQMAVNFGVLRLINEQLQSGVNFDKLSILHRDFLDHTTLCQDQIALHKAFVDAATHVGKIVLTLDGLAEKVELSRSSGLFSGWTLVQGHDLMQLMAIAINSDALKFKTGHRQASEESLARDLCLMMHRNDLERTVMFQGLHHQGDLVGLAFFK
jgi:hypothetical protein